jgi:arabinan endo-1,5-alpha-L-arabinosidase
MIEPEGFIQCIHDPVIAGENGTSYVFSTGTLIPFICSKDKTSWEYCGRVFGSNPAWTHAISPNRVDIWAPDISFFNNQWLFYCTVSNFGSKDSAIGLAANLTLNLKIPNFKIKKRVSYVI